MGKRVTKSFSLLHEELTLGYYIIKTALGEEKTESARVCHPFCQELRLPPTWFLRLFHLPPLKGLAYQAQKGQPMYENQSLSRIRGPVLKGPCGRSGHHRPRFLQVI